MCSRWFPDALFDTWAIQVSHILTHDDIYSSTMTYLLVEIYLHMFIMWVCNINNINVMLQHYFLQSL